MIVSPSKHPRYPWRAKWKEGAKQRNRYFKSEKEARRFAQRKGVEIRDIAPSEHSPKRAEEWARQAFGRPLPKNVARHSFVSYHLALFGDIASTELQAGHDRAVMFQHYRELVTREDAESYFSITF